MLFLVSQHRSVFPPPLLSFSLIACISGSRPSRLTVRVSPTVHHSLTGHCLQDSPLEEGFPDLERFSTAYRPPVPQFVGLNKAESPLDEEVVVAEAKRCLRCDLRSQTSEVTLPPKKKRKDLEEQLSTYEKARYLMYEEYPMYSKLEDLFD